MWFKKKSYIQSGTTNNSDHAPTGKVMSMEPYGGKLMLRAKVEKVIHGPIPHQVIALFEFPDSAAIDTWYNSDEYQALVPLRDEAAVIRFAVAESFWLTTQYWLHLNYIVESAYSVLQQPNDWLRIRRSNIV